MKKKIRRLTEAQVREIREALTPKVERVSQASLAKKFGVSQVAIHNAFRGITYKKVA